MVKKSTILEVSDQRFWESLPIIPERSDLTPGGLGGEAPQDSGGVREGVGRSPLRCCLIYSVNRMNKGQRKPNRNNKSQTRSEPSRDQPNRTEPSQSEAKRTM